MKAWNGELHWDSSTRQDMTELMQSSHTPDRRGLKALLLVGIAAVIGICWWLR